MTPIVTAAYDDPPGQAAAAILERKPDLVVGTADLDESFTLDEGENAAVTLANDVGADQLLCDEIVYERYGLIDEEIGIVEEAVTE